MMVVLRPYLLYTQQSLLAMLRVLYFVAGIKLESAACKVSTLPAVLYLCPLNPFNGPKTSDSLEPCNEGCEKNVYIDIERA